MMERVSDKWLNHTVKNGADLVDRPIGDYYKVLYALEELQARRKAEKEQRHTDHSGEEKDSAEATQERERAILPLPVKSVDGVSVEKCTVKQWFGKINEELDELKEVLLRWSDLDSIKPDTDYMEVEDHKALADEGADTITAITSMLEAMGIDERQRQEAQKRVNEHNRQKERL